ncbi:hypothetical protein DW114_05305 [Absiella sp. AM09-50]|jgi:hypothetical protein|nr:hypothetical protein DW271_08925 [Absiella sp. AM22-9]RGB62677.1 hypothetical protein DW120_02100 [Absiella sp. AM10-20]RGB69507.1 hypothetical protein DW113_02245 [Absiella sp. AM09-45]RGB77725.1 hypothetical protein DW114_05305 [Absiella sp. AM09-50]RHU10068.1 hypothetical protein DW716_02415 [Absiella sp. AM27-20]
MKGDGDINRRVINPLEWKALIKDFKKEYGFDLEKDLKNVNMTSYEFVKILKDLSFDINSNPIKGNKVTSIPPISVYKMRYKDEYRHIGTSNAYRFHLYHKTSGRKPKLDLTEKEKKLVKKMVEDAVAQRR